MFSEMSQSIKRDAAEAFEGKDDTSARPTKKRGRPRKRNVNVENGIAKGSQSDDTIEKKAKHIKSPYQAAPGSLGPLEERIEKPPKSSITSPTNENRTQHPNITKAKVITKIESPKFKESKRGDSSTITPSEKVKEQSMAIPEKVKEQDKEEETSGEWNMSNGYGGLFIKQDPILTKDGKYVFLATQSEVQVYSASTSLLVRRFEAAGQNATITSYVQSLSNPSNLVISTKQGSVYLWDWTEGHLVHQWQFRKGLRRLVPLRANSNHESILLVHKSKLESTVSVHTWKTSHFKAKESSTLLKQEEKLSNVHVLEDGNLIVATTSTQLLVGQLQHSSEESIEHQTYIWREMTFSGIITSFDAQVIRTKSKNGAKTLNVVVGLKSGIILLFEDILFRLSNRDKAKSSEDILARKLHWHRDQVNSVKWSRDGNYVISGGNETVLVIWQLDTNLKQFLPHLSTAILNVAVSAGGSEYVLRLGDNSVMVLSTADLAPSTNIPGLALGRGFGKQGQIILHPTIPDRLIAAVSAHSMAELAEPTATLLQDYDLNSNSQIVRQALTRNTTTVLNIGPNGQKVKEPDVTAIQISADGKWLATTEHWIRNSEDLDAMYLLEDDKEVRSRRMESCLRFWIWNANDNNWELVTRVDEPHSTDSQSVLELVTHPSKLEFATIGSDGTVRRWSPKARVRDGVPIKNKSGEQLYTWNCSKTIQCEKDGTNGEEDGIKATISYAEDGSVIAASWSSSHSSLRYIHLIDARTGKICLSQPGLATSGDLRLAFASRYLLSLSGRFSIFDTVSAQETFGITLNTELASSTTSRYLATNRIDASVAIAFSGRNQSQILLFNANDLKSGPTFAETYPWEIKAFLASPTSPGYTIIDDRSRTRHLRPQGTSSVITALPRVESERVNKGLDSIFGAISSAPANPIESAGPKLLEDSPAHRTTDNLLNLQSSAHALPVGELFERIASLFARNAVVRA